MGKDSMRSLALAGSLLVSVQNSLRKANGALTGLRPELLQGVTSTLQIQNTYNRVHMLHHFTARHF